MQANYQDGSAQATILTYGGAESRDRKIAALAEYYGVDCSTADLRQSNSASVQQASGCMMIDARSLSAAARDRAIGTAALVAILDKVSFVLVYGITDREASGVRAVTDGLVSSAVSFEREDYKYQVADGETNLTEELSGLTFGPIRNDIDYGLTLSRHDNSFSALVSINQLPMFGCLRKERSNVFFLACADVAEPQAPTDCTLFARKYFSTVAPVIMFLRQAFGDRIWRNKQRCASLVIDDPLLQKTYGFLNYSEILDAMDSSNFAASIAFIPWNYRRTDPATAELVKTRPDRFSICVHGCDHTGGEFASDDAADLDRRVQLATFRMRNHEQRTGVPYADIMVFPQGKFSSLSLSVLKKHNYLAAVNSTVKPEDLRNSHGITLGDLLAPAVCRYAGFPLFMRRYPRELADFAFDLFLDKPALVVEHHGYFKHGYDKIREFASQLNKLSAGLEWKGIGDVAKQTYLQRTRGGEVHYRIFANRHTIRNPQPGARTFTVSKAEHQSIPVQGLAVNGKQHPYSVQNGELSFQVEIPASGSAEVSITYATVRDDSRQHKSSFKQEVKTYMRRHLSEVRDNYLAKHDGLLSLANRVKNGGRSNV